MVCDGLCKFIAQYLLDVDFVWKCVYGALSDESGKAVDYVSNRSDIILFGGKNV